MLKANYTLLLISFLLVSIKWITSYHFFQETIDVKVIFESVYDSKVYYPLIKYLSEFQFNNSYDPQINNLKIIPLPIAGILLHSFLMKTLSFYSFIIADIICVFLFLYIFYCILRLATSSYISIVFAILIFLLPTLISSSYLNDFSYLQNFARNFYNLRVPRPMISNLYFFGFLLLILKLNINFKYNYKLFSLLGCIVGLTLSSFYYFFFTQVIIFLSFLIIKFKQKIISEVLNNYKYYLLGFLVFIITIIPFTINLVFHESEFTARQCIYELDYNKKKELLGYLVNKYLSFKFIFLFLTISILNIFINYFKYFEKKIINIFYISFISSLFAPVIFILLSNKSCVFYHFINFIIVNGFLYLIIFTLLTLNSLLNLKLKNFLKFCVITFFIFLYGILNWNEIKNKYDDISNNKYRNEFSIVTNKIKKNFSLEGMSILTFETDLIIWSIMNDVKHLNLINSIFTSKKDYMIEEDIFSSFKILGLSEENFKLFIENRKSTWRYINTNISKFLYYKYQANSLVTFKNSKDFTTEENDHIKKTHILLHQQSIIPKFEIDRLMNDFKNFDKKLPYPDVIILNKKDDFFDFQKLVIKKYCKILDGENFIMYFKSEKDLCEN